VAAQANQVTLLRTSGDYFADFHPVSSRRYVVMISGEREYEVADGQKFRLRAGDVMLVDDTTGTGHATRGVGEDSVNMLVTLTDLK
jgi:quercetin dioxygenase-like cupin family protein